jgi:WD40 repeat protein
MYWPVVSSDTLAEDCQNSEFEVRSVHQDLLATFLQTRRFGARALFCVCAFLSIQSCVSGGSGSDDVNALGRIAAKLGHSEEIGEIAWHPDGNRIVVADDRNQSLNLWDLSAKNKIWRINKYGNITADSIDFSRDGEAIVVSSTAAIVPAPNRNPLARLL